MERILSSFTLLGNVAYYILDNMLGIFKNMSHIIKPSLINIACFAFRCRRRRGFEEIVSDSPIHKGLAILILTGIV